MTSTHHEDRDPPEEPRPTEALRLMTWDVAGAREEVSRRQAKWLAASPYDVMVLTGVDARHQALDEALREHGLETLAPSRPSSTGNDHIVIAARHHHLSPLDVPPPREQPHRCVPAQLTPLQHAPLPPTPLVIAGVYVPGHGGLSRRHADKRAFKHAGKVWLPKVIAAAGEQPLIVAGSLKLQEPGEFSRFAELAPWECDFYWSWARMGLTDLYRATHPDQVSPDSRWFGLDDLKVQRFDQIWISDGHLPGSGCSYDDQPGREGLGEFPALTAELDYGPRPRGHHADRSSGRQSTS
ncbi:hypothetical protein [Kineosporia babensis]|uniref:Uncharacterized protein n=1 Tax=Kineosporia babensis TaxID=499548 RepID=A0A9X1SY07_9ACTN|nr:hypothetical protein [Kineosporia babensis]MCD5316571.1 hypothetical protein [Kineosporia babensis]